MNIPDMLDYYLYDVGSYYQHNLDSNLENHLLPDDYEIVRTQIVDYDDVIVSYDSNYDRSQYTINFTQNDKIYRLECIIINSGGSVGEYGCYHMFAELLCFEEVGKND